MDEVADVHERRSLLGDSARDPRMGVPSAQTAIPATRSRYAFPDSS